jgi:hypothetical protein
MSYRTKLIDPDYRHTGKTMCWCGICGKDITSAKPPRWYAAELDKFDQVIHPEDIAIARTEIIARRPEYSHPHNLVVFERIGPECARRLGAEWTLDQAAYDAVK